MPPPEKRPKIKLDDIILATDFSVAAQRAAGYAVQIARRYRSRLHVVSVVDLNIPIPAGDGTCILPIEELVHASQERVATLVRGIPDVSCVMHTPESFSVPVAIRALAQEFKASLIVMGTTSKGTWKKLLLGSTAEEVIRKARIPVLTVGPHVLLDMDSSLPFRRIVFANELSPESANAFPLALSVAEDSGARIYICRVVSVDSSPVPTAADQALERSLQLALPAAAIDWCEPECVVEHGDPTEAILALAERVTADLIVVGSRKSSFTVDYLERGLTPAVIAAAKCPVLSLCS
jgi:nucleotide-binding universal stress UspA family protein